MQRSIGWSLAALLACATPAAAAAGARIELRGAIVEPTCHVRGDLVVSPSTALRQTCGTGGATAITYVRTVQSLDAQALARDRLLGYFATYAAPPADGAPPVHLVVRTYE